MEAELRFLVVEDSPEDERLLVRHLEKAGLTFTVLRAETEAAVCEALEGPLDLVITDYLLPGLTGERVLDLVRDRRPSLPVIVVSGRGGEELAVAMMRRGASDYILKENLPRVPFAAHRLLKEAGLRTARARAEDQVLRLGRMYRLLSETNQAIVRIAEPRELLAEVCRLACRLGPFHLVRVVRPGAAGPEVFAFAGLDDGGSLEAEAAVLATGRPPAAESGPRALFPLRTDGTVWGCLGFHSPDRGDFNTEETALLRDLAEDLSFGLEARSRDRARRETERLLTDMASLVPGMFFKLRFRPAEGFSFLYVSPGIDLILPYSAAQVTADVGLLLRALHPRDRRRFFLAGTRSLRQLTVMNHEFRMVRPNGAVVWVLGTAFPQKQDDGGVVWTGVALDVTPQNQLQEALDRERQLLSVVLNNIGDGVVAVDEAGRLALVNRTARRLVGADRTAAEGAPWQDLEPGLPWSARDRFVPWYRRRDDGTELHLEAHVADLAEPGTAARGQVMLLRDMTDRDRIEDRLHQSEKLESIGLLAGGIAHDFNNLLTGLFGFIQLARMNAGDSVKVIEYLDHVQGPFQRARTLTQQLLTFAKGGQPAKALVPVGGLLEALVPAAFREGPTVGTVDGAAGAWPVLANESQLRQVFENLLLNAAQALGEGGGSVRVCLRNHPAPGPGGRGLEPGDFVEVAVADDGPGIPPEALPKVFDPFFTTKSQGTGLGLSICYSVVRKHGGSIEVESPPGAGTTFRLFWPARSPGESGA